MSKEKYNQIIDDVYKNFEKWYNEHSGKEDYTGYYVPTKEEFIRLVKTDSEFSEKWRLKVEERELSLVEMIKLAKYENEEELIKTRKHNIDVISERLLKDNIPTREITLTYNNERIEIYE